MTLRFGQELSSGRFCTVTPPWAKRPRLAQPAPCAPCLVALGEPRQVLPELVKRQSPALLVMGAYGHSRLRQWLVGSTTTSLLRLSEVPVLILR